MEYVKINNKAYSSDCAFKQKWYGVANEESTLRSICDDSQRSIGIHITLSNIIIWEEINNVILHI